MSRRSHGSVRPTSQTSGFPSPALASSPRLCAPSAVPFPGASRSVLLDHIPDWLWFNKPFPVTDPGTRWHGRIPTVPGTVRPSSQESAGTLSSRTGVRGALGHVLLPPPPRILCRPWHSSGPSRIDLCASLPSCPCFTQSGSPVNVTEELCGGLHKAEGLELDRLPPSTVSIRDRPKSLRSKLQLELPYLLLLTVWAGNSLTERIQDQARHPEEELVYDQVQLPPHWTVEKPLEPGNMTRVQHFVLLGLSTRLSTRDALFAVFLALYLLTLLENTLIIYLICRHTELHKPMYFFLGNLSGLEMCYVSVTMPTLLVGLWTGPYRISFMTCMTQLFFFITLIGTECT
uniref:Olfactory receptor 1G1-like n=2 Tax=Chinchilla lanigera TaxID=34839 RepID=A0A8C2UME2_CHILA